MLKHSTAILASAVPAVPVQRCALYPRAEFFKFEMTGNTWLSASC